MAARPTNDGKPAGVMARAVHLFGSPAARHGLSALFLAGAGYLIWRQVSAISLAAFLAALFSTSPLALASSLLFTACSYACLSITEWLSARALGHAFAFRDAARVAVPAYALTNSAGFSPLTGTALRLQLYRRFGLGARSAAAVAVVAGTAVTLSGLVTLGLCFAADPKTAAEAVHGPRWAPLILSGLLITPAALWFIAFSARAPAWLGGRKPGGLGRRLRALGLAAGLGDWLFSGLALFVLLQAPHAASFPAFLAAFVAGCLLSAATGVPGGVGVFEAIVLSLTALVSQAHETAAALLMYRALYSLLPLMGVGLVKLAGHLKRQPVDRARRRP